MGGPPLASGAMMRIAAGFVCDIDPFAPGGSEVAPERGIASPGASGYGFDDDAAFAAPGGA